MLTTSASSSLDSQRRLFGLRLGEYVLGPRLGAGGTASVYLAREMGADGGGRLVALKVIHDHLLEEADFVRMFIDEANLARRMSHPNVVKVFEFGREGESIFLAMEYLHGQPLSRLFERLAKRGQRLPFDLVMWIGARVAEGLQHAHELKGDRGQPLEVIHRDVSPQNIFLTYDGQVKLIDFGIAKAEGRLAKTTLGRIKGKFAYMAPEQVLGSDFDQRADLFALGATLYELTVGVRLFAGDDQTDTLQKLLFEEIPDPADQDPNVPGELSAIIRKALAAEPENRYATAAEIGVDLDALLAKQGYSDEQVGLSQLMNACFAPETRESALAISQLREIGLPREQRPSAIRTSEEPSVPDGLSATQTSNQFVAKTSGLMGAAGVAVLLAAAGATAFVFARTEPDNPAPLTPRQKVTIDIQIQPDVQSRITLDGKVIFERPARVTVDKSDTPLDIVVQANGFETERLRATPDRDQLLRVGLMKKVAPVASFAPAASSSREDLASASTKSKSTAATTRKGAAPPSTGRPPATSNKPASTSTGSLVTEYPF